MMLANLGRPELDVRIIDAVRQLLIADQTTPELGGVLTTSQVTDALLARLG
jgi:isocitrate/isopropylmalate dehydrogenase